MTIIKGQEITELRTIGSQYNNDCLQVNINGDLNYRIKVSEILKLNTDFNNVNFRLVKKKKYTYLEVA